MTEHPSDLALTAERRLLTGESHRSLLAMMEAGHDVQSIPEASREQADLEAGIFLKTCKIGGLSAHPAGILKVQPKSTTQLTIRLLDEPYVIHHWADHLLPERHSRVTGYPEDQIGGLPGLRYRVGPRAITLYRPGHDAEVRLTGFNTRWWTRISANAQSRRDILATESDWTDLEKAAHTSSQKYSADDARLASPLLRRIRATAGPGEINATDAWTSGHSLRVETTDGPACDQLVEVFNRSLGWQLERGWCGCRSSRRDGCCLNFKVPETGQEIDYSNLRWGRSADPRRLAHVAELNSLAFA
ncbi:hypothetical protein [Streptomyces rubellomurinus]|uniref:Uncharacterized protein n=1 Tax=Streptomyces rubellomurinus (strain ATCC 31215) TaxID=359131 RepID=A0A0F2TBT7_STRR3|nr:hypothetical protein [Streptomyces rubellomurinus]KJS59931.1 hypothetical protein VM95_24115 [Streptomyces rubellomurinus]